MKNKFLENEGFLNKESREGPNSWVLKLRDQIVAHVALI